MMVARKRMLRTPLLALAIFWIGSQAQAAKFESQISQLAADVHKALVAQNYSTCKIQINGPTMYPSSGPALITELLGTHLTRLGITPKKLRADVGLLGQVKVREVKDAGSDKVSSLVLVITLEFVDRNDNPILSLDSRKINIVDRGEIARILGIPFEPHQGPKPAPVPGQKPPQEEGVHLGFTDPHQHLTGTVVRAKRDGLFGIEIIKSGQACPVGLEDGLAFIDLKKSDKCHIRLVNDAPFEVAVRLTLDGIDCFWFSKKQKGMWLLKPHSSLTVKGWQIDNTFAREFQIVPFEKSVAAKVGAVGSVGVIAAGFHRAYQEHEPYAPGDSPLKGVPPIGIGEGAEFVNRVKSVPRKVGKIRGAVPIRYAKPTVQH